MARYVRWFAELGIEDVPLVGGKNASLGEMYRELTPLGVKVPNGFATTAQAYRDTLERAGVWPKLRELMAGLDPDDVEDLARRGAQARALIYGSGGIWRGSERRRAFIRHRRGSAHGQLRGAAGNLPQHPG